jgi:hypothetical protein
MAVAVQEPITSVDLVTEAVLGVYRSRIDDATEMTLAEVLGTPDAAGAVRAIVASKDRTVEVVLDDESHPDALANVAWLLDDKSWKLNVIVALERLGDAHTALRGTPATLQGWWYEDDAVRFAGYERP